MIDVDGSLCALIEEIEGGLHRLHGLLVGKREAARKAPELQSAVVDEYSNTIAVIAELHNLMVELGWAIGEHDADLEKPSGPAYSTRDELKAYLKTL